MCLPVSISVGTFANGIAGGMTYPLTCNNMKFRLPNQPTVPKTADKASLHDLPGHGRDVVKFESCSAIPVQR